MQTTRYAKAAITALMLMMSASSLLATETATTYDLTSPDSTLSLRITAGATLEWSLHHNGRVVIAPSAISMTLSDGTVLGAHASVTRVDSASFSGVIKPVIYKKSIIRDEYRQLTLHCTDAYDVVFRLYNEGMAYRFITKKPGEITVMNEEANFNFTEDHQTFIPYLEDFRDGKQFNSAFESHYQEIPLSRFDTTQLAFLPLLVELKGGVSKAAILEADLDDYPGMFLTLNRAHNGLTSVFAPYPLETKRGGFSGFNLMPTRRADYIARTQGTRSFPWRVVVIARQDKDLLNSDIVQKLASPSRIADPSWITPGQVAWDWWNDWNITHVNFRAGINTETYKYYIDFAAAHHIRYIVIDEGWSETYDLTKPQSSINLREILAHGRKKGVDVILWALWQNVARQMDTVFAMYSKMGVKGFKIDFFDRDDQAVVASTYEIAKKAAEYHLLVDYHGIFKPTGLQRTYPNVIGYEGVKGLEHMKWNPEDAVRYAVSIPFIRMMAGPMDYTPGAMRNTTRGNFKPSNSLPMSQGTRCQQLAMYVVYEAPLQMLSDNPTAYMKEAECTEFITSVPTVYDESIALDGKVGDYAAVARKKSGVWYLGAMNNWDARDLTLDCSFLGEGRYKAVIFKDGINADRDATDYQKEQRTVSAHDTLTIHLAPGGGCAARFEKIR
ncbi:MAG TPA: glycoside hydrolase family 97 protein [Bacteroidota bacterium]|nr:glycoside hydrolase family 97 protein [Bacteroidota bacterium]